MSHGFKRELTNSQPANMTDKAGAETLGGQISNIVNRLRKSAIKGTTGGISAGTTVRSSLGYQRWTKTGDDSSNDKRECAESRPAGEECDPLNAEAEERFGESDSSVADSKMGDCSSGPSSKSGSSTSIDVSAEPAVAKVDTITEWQAGWNVTNAIQVCDVPIPCLILQHLVSVGQLNVMNGGMQVRHFSRKCQLNINLQVMVCI